MKKRTLIFWIYLTCICITGASIIFYRHMNPPSIWDEYSIPLYSGISYTPVRSVSEGLLKAAIAIALSAILATITWFLTRLICRILRRLTRATARAITQIWSHWPRITLVLAGIALTSTTLFPPWRTRYSTSYTFLFNPGRGHLDIGVLILQYIAIASLAFPGAFALYKRSKINTENTGATHGNSTHAQLHPDQ